jgi:sulfur carrier protein ThiS adenylyltransferase
MNIFEQGLLKYITETQLRAIQAIKIGIGGAGGLGSNCSMCLTRCGFKYFEIIDHDIVEASNLNRQAYELEDLGKPKVGVLRQHLLRVNPDLNLTTRQTRWDSLQGNDFFQQCDFIIEAFDQAPIKYEFVNFYHEKTGVVVSGNGMAGLRNNKQMIRRQLGNIILIGDGSTSIADGHPPMAPRVTQCAAMMAEAVLEATLEKIS